MVAKGEIYMQVPSEDYIQDEGNQMHLNNKGYIIISTLLENEYYRAPGGGGGSQGGWGGVPSN